MNHVSINIDYAERVSQKRLCRTDAKKGTGLNKNCYVSSTANSSHHSESVLSDLDEPVVSEG